MPGLLTGTSARASTATLFERLVSAFTAAGEIRDVLRAQLEGVVETSDRMAAKVIEEAQVTSGAASRLSQFMKESALRAETIFARVRNAIATSDATSRQVLDDRAVRLAATSDSAQKTVLEHKRLERLGESAHGLGMRIRIVAMNTSIEALHSGGKTGTTVGVLAHEIAALAVEVQTLGLELSHSSHELGLHLHRDLVEGLQAEVVALYEARNVIGTQVAQLRHAYAELADFQTAVWAKVELAAEQIVTVASALGGLQYQDVLRQRLVHVVGVLLKLAERDEALKQALSGARSLPDDWKPIGLDELAKDYVMGAQRIAHAQGAPVTADLPEIELF